MASSMLTSTSASFGTGLSIASEPNRAIRQEVGCGSFFYRKSAVSAGVWCTR